MENLVGGQLSDKTVRRYEQRVLDLTSTDITKHTRLISTTSARSRETRDVRNGVTLAVCCGVLQKIAEDSPAGDIHPSMIVNQDLGQIVINPKPDVGLGGITCSNRDINNTLESLENEFSLSFVSLPAANGSMVKHIWIFKMNGIPQGEIAKLPIRGLHSDVTQIGEVWVMCGSAKSTNKKKKRGKAKSDGKTDNKDASPVGKANETFMYKTLLRDVIIPYFKETGERVRAQRKQSFSASLSISKSLTPEQASAPTPISASDLKDVAGDTTPTTIEYPLTVPHTPSSTTPSVLSNSPPTTAPNVSLQLGTTSASQTEIGLFMADGQYEQNQAYFETDGNTQQKEKSALRDDLMSLNVWILKYARSCSGAQQIADLSPIFKSFNTMLRKGKYDNCSIQDSVQDMERGINSLCTMYNFKKGPWSQKLSLFARRVPQLVAKACTTTNILKTFVENGQTYPFDPALIVKKSVKNFNTRHWTAEQITEAYLAIPKLVNYMLQHPKEKLTETVMDNFNVPKTEQQILAEQKKKENQKNQDDFAINRQRAIFLNSEWVDERRSAFAEKEHAKKEAAEKKAKEKSVNKAKQAKAKAVKDKKAADTKLIKKLQFHREQLKEILAPLSGQEIEDDFKCNLCQTTWYQWHQVGLTEEKGFHWYGCSSEKCNQWYCPSCSQGSQKLVDLHIKKCTYAVGEEKKDED